MKKALHFGAGNIGRGFIGKLLSESGYEVTFADVNKEVIDELNKEHKYDVYVVGETKEKIEVSNVNGVLSGSEDLLNIISEADIITTAVGPTVLKIISSDLQKGLEKRYSNGNDALTIIACENMVRATSQLKEYVLEKSFQEIKDKINSNVSFVDSAVDRIVPPPINKEKMLDVTVEEFSEWIVDKTQFKNDIPNITGMQLEDNLMSFVERKIFTLNTGHAVTSYLGFLKNYETIRDSILDENILRVVTDVMKESGEVLIKRYSFDRETHYKYIDKILDRFRNKYLVDEVSRVGRQPIRKLSKSDRLIKPLNGTLEYGTSNENLLKGISCALKYRNNEDEQAIELEKLINEGGPEKVLKEVSEITDENLISKIVELYNKDIDEVLK